MRRSTLKRFTRLVLASQFSLPSKCEARPFDRIHVGIRLYKDDAKTESAGI